MWQNDNDEPIHVENAELCEVDADDCYSEDDHSIHSSNQDDTRDDDDEDDDDDEEADNVQNVEGAVYNTDFNDPQFQLGMKFRNVREILHATAQNQVKL